MRKSRVGSHLFCAAALICCAVASVAHAQEVVINGGFETGDFTSWTVNDPSNFTNVGNDPLFAHSGTFHANLGASPNLGTLSQSLATMTGQTYNLSFWLANDGGANPGNGELNEFDALWNGNTVLAQTNVSVSNYTQYTFSLMATSPSTVLQFNYRNDVDFFRLDDVSVTAVPEVSTTWLLLSTGIVGLLFFRKTQRG